MSILAPTVGDGAVDAHPAGGDELVGGASRGDAAPRQEAVEPLAGAGRRRGHGAAPPSCAPTASRRPAAERLVAERRQVVDPLEADDLEEAQRGAEEPRPPGVSWRSTSAMRPRRSRLSSTASQLTPADRLDAGPGQRLPVGDDGERLQRGTAQPGGPLRLERALHRPGRLRAG